VADRDARIRLNNLHRPILKIPASNSRAEFLLHQGASRRTPVHTSLRRRYNVSMSANGDPKLSAMEGAGFYNRHSAMQAVGVSRALSLWASAGQSVQIGEEPLVIVDYASSQGRNSMSPVRTAIETIRSRCGAQKLVEVIHTDLPSNDFSSLFTALEQEPDSYLRGMNGVFPAAIGRSSFIL
jgi:hypothetical protein